MQIYPTKSRTAGLSDIGRKECIPAKKFIGKSFSGPGVLGTSANRVLLGHPIYMRLYA